MSAAAAVLVSGCGGGGSGPTSANGSSTAQPVRGGTLRVGGAGEAITLNPSAAADDNSEFVFRQIIEPLFNVTTKGQIAPELALGATPSNDYRTWTIALRKGVVFSNGKPLAAADVVYSINVARKSANWGSIYPKFTQVRAASPSSVVITASKPVPTLEAILALPFGGIVPANLDGMSSAQFGQHPIGTGPFKLASWNHGQSITLVRNPRYWDPKQPVLDKLIFETVTNDNSRVLQLRAGELDMIQQPPLSQVASLQHAQGIRTGVYTWGSVDDLILNAKSQLFADPRVREAASLAIDSNAILRAATFGLGKRGGAWLPPVVPDWNTDLPAPTPDLTKAKQLLAGEVRAKGLQPTFALLVVSGGQSALTEAQILQSDLDKVGFNVKIQQVDVSAQINSFGAGRYQAGIQGPTTDIMDQSELTGFYIALKGLWSQVSTAEVSRLYSQALTEADPSKRRQLYYQIQSTIAQQRGVIPLVYEPFVWAMQDKIVGFQLAPTGVPWFGTTGFAG